MLYRNDAKTDDYRQIAWIDGGGSTPVGTDYQFVNQDVQPGGTSFYYLEDVDGQGTRTKSVEVFVTVPLQKSKCISNCIQLLRLTTRKIVSHQCRLFQNFLNPFNPETWLLYALPKAAYWDGRDNIEELISSGIYFYYLRAGEFQATKKMIVIRWTAFHNL